MWAPTLRVHKLLTMGRLLASPLSQAHSLGQRLVFETTIRFIMVSLPTLGRSS